MLFWESVHTQCYYIYRSGLDSTVCCPSCGIGTAIVQFPALMRKLIISVTDGFIAFMLLFFHHSNDSVSIQGKLSSPKSTGSTMKGFHCTCFYLY